MNIGARIRNLREAKGYSQNKLADWSGVAQSHIRRVELGDSDITVGHLELICNELGVTLAEFFGGGELDELDLACRKLSAEQRRALAAFVKKMTE